MVISNLKDILAYVHGLNAEHIDTIVEVTSRILSLKGFPMERFKAYMNEEIDGHLSAYADVLFDLHGSFDTAGPKAIVAVIFGPIYEAIARMLIDELKDKDPNIEFKIHVGINPPDTWDTILDFHPLFKLLASAIDTGSWNDLVQRCWTGYPVQHL